MNNLIKKINHSSSNADIISLWVLLIVFIISVTLTAVYFITKTKANKIQNSNGDLVLLIDMNKLRIKIANPDSAMYNEPWFYKKLNIISGQWVKLDDFIAVFDKYTKEKFMDILQNNLNESIDTEITSPYDSKLITYVNITIQNYDNDQIMAGFSWEEKDIRENSVFEDIETNLTFLSQPKEKYTAVLFTLDIKNIYNVQNFINLFKENAIKNSIQGVKVFLDWNKLFFVFTESRFGNNRAKYVASQFVEWSYNYIKLYRQIFIIDSSLLIKKTKDEFEKFFDYLKIYSITDKRYRSFEPDKNVLESEKYHQFSLAYQNILNWSANVNLESKKIIFRNLQGQKTEMKELIIPDVFSELGCKDAETLTQLDIYKNIYVNIYSQIRHIRPNYSIITLKDFIFNAIDFEKIANANKYFDGFLQVIEFTTFKAIKKIKENIVKSEKQKRGFCLKISSINEDILSIVDNWVKFVIIDCKLSSRLNEPEILLFMNGLFDKLNANGTKIIFEKLDYKSYRKILYKHTQDILYTQ